MKQKILDFIKRKKFTSLIILLVIILLSYWLFGAFNDDTNTTTYTLAEVEKGSIITSVSGSGQVSVVNQIDIKSKTSGEVTKLTVKNGQEVKTGDLLAQFDAEDAYKAVRDAELNLESAKISLEKLKQENSGSSFLAARNAVTKAQRDLEIAKKEQEQQDLTSTQSYENAYQDAYTALSSLYLDTPTIIDDLKEFKRDVSNYRTVLGEHYEPIDTFIDNYTLAYESHKTNSATFNTISRASDQTTIYQAVSDTYIMVKEISQALENARIILDETLDDGDYEEGGFTETELETTQSTILEHISAINDDITDLQDKKDQIDSANQDNPINNQQAADTVTSAEETLREKQLALEDVTNGSNALDIQSQEITVKQRENSLNDAKDDLADYSLYVPFDGIISETRIKKGEQISSGTVVATLITKQRTAEISLNEVDVAKVALDQKATLTFDALEDLTLTGKVAEIDTVGTVDQGVVTYNVKIVFDTEDDRVKPGMTVNADIVTATKLDILLVPNSAVKTQDDTYYVEIIDDENSAPTQKTIEIGIANDSYTEVISGLSEGDQVVEKTNDSSSETSAKTTTSLFGGGGPSGGNMGMPR